MKPEEREIPSSELKSSFPCTFGNQPWLIRLDASNRRTHIFVDPFSAKIRTKKVKALEKKICLGSFQEWLLLMEVSTNEPFLFSPISGTEIRLPILSEPLESVGGFVLSSDPTTPKCTVVLVCKDQKFILHCRPNGSQWVKVLFPSVPNITGHIVICKGIAYILARNRSFQFGNFHNVLSINVDSLPNGIIDFAIQEYSMHHCKSAVLHLVVNGENVFLIAFHLISGVIAGVETHLMETSTISWGKKHGSAVLEKVKISDGRIYILGAHYSMSFVPNNADMRCNCIYLLRSEHDGEKLYEISLDDQIISSLRLPKKESTERSRFCWVVPSRSRIRKEKSTSCQNVCLIERGQGKITKIDDMITSNISRPWADMPVELVELLLPHLGLVDCIRLPSICKAWSSLSKTVLQAKRWPWLMYFPSNCHTCRLFDPIYNEEYTIDMEWFTSGKKSTLHFSKDGWVLLSTEDHSFYVLNPFTRETVQLPDIYSAHEYSFSFSSLPSSSDFMVFGTWGVDDCYSEGIKIWWRGEKTWKSCYATDFGISFHMAWSSPVFMNGVIYCLGRRGDLGAFDPDSETWEVFETPVHSEAPAAEIEDCYLLELDGEVILVFVERSKPEVQIFMLDHEEWAWNKQEDLGDLTLFLDHKNSVAKKSMLERSYANRIYFSSFGTDGGRKIGAYYSIESGSYHPRFNNLKRPMNCVWLEPNLSENNITNS